MRGEIAQDGEIFEDMFPGKTDDCIERHGGKTVCNSIRSFRILFFYLVTMG